MTALTPLGLFHTAISLLALACAVVALVRDREISPLNRIGQTYLAATLLTAASGLGIFQHGGFGPPHTLSLLTLAALAVGVTATYSTVFGSGSRYVRLVSFSSTVLFHAIPGVTETLTRLPAGAPLVASADAPVFKALYGALLVAFLAGLAAQ